ncbi:hypothetical protein [Serratia ureilytica]|uniref:hypothetical protein n=1 Tax=Serratia ureilytica TaxID=300181 RepID=UPI003F7DB56B
MTLTTEQLRARAKFWREKAVEAKWESVSIAQDMLQNADAFDELAANREAQPVAWRHDDGPFAGIAITRSKSVADNWMAKGWAVTPLYTAPPAPAVPDKPRLPPHIYRDLLDMLQEAAIAYGGTQQLRAQLSSALSIHVQPDHPHTRAAMLAQPVSGGYKLPEGFKLMPLEMTDEIGEAIAMEARCCGGIALCIYEAALAAAPEGGNDHDTRR